MKYVYILLLSIFTVGMLFAIDDVTDVDEVSEGRYSAGGSLYSNVTEAGNVSAINITSNVSTSKWAGFKGNVTSTIVLSPSDYASRMYDWSWSDSNGGEVCISTSNSVDWSSLTDTSAAEIDTAWGFTSSAADSAANTLTSTYGWNIAGQTGTAPSTTLVNPVTTSFAIKDVAGAPAISNLIFCSAISSTASEDYGVIAPAATGGSTTTYYFYLELS